MELVRPLLRNWARASLQNVVAGGRFHGLGASSLRCARGTARRVRSPRDTRPWARGLSFERVAGIAHHSDLEFQMRAPGFGKNHAQIRSQSIAELWYELGYMLRNYLYLNVFW